MHLLIASLPFVAGGCLLLGLVLGARAWRGPGARRRGFLACHPAHRAWLRGLRLTEPEQFLALAAFHVSGHPGRHVARVTLGDGPDAVTAYLKCEIHVGWRVRLKNFLAGFGFVSHSLREAQTLRAVEREGLGGPPWLAAGQDAAGRAFLLVRAVADPDLATFLHREKSRSARRRLARRLGAALARLHDAGFEHRDLYAKHVLVGPDAVHFLDWQRAAQSRRVGWRGRVRDLAALHATLADALAGPRERLACLRAYLRAARQHRAAPGWVLRGVAEEARRLLTRRHVREKRAARPAGPAQAWIHLDGEALCVTPALGRRLPGRPFDWLALDRQPLPPGREVARRWLPLPGGRALLVRRSARQPLAARCTDWLLGRPLGSPEQRQAALLLRLERHGLTAPRVLALGQRRGPGGRVESFLLTEPPADAVALPAWLGRCPPTPGGATRRRLLCRAGAFVRRLHDANCYLAGDPGAVGVQAPAGGAPRPVLTAADGVCPLKREQPDRASRDLRSFRRLLRAAGCGPAELRAFLGGYRRSGPAAPAGPPAPPAAGRSSPAGRGGERDTFWSRIFRGSRRLRQRHDWAAFAGPGWADAIMGAAVTDRFHAKQGRSTGRWVLRAPGDPGRTLVVYLKRHYQLPWWQGLLATLFPGGDWSPAMQEWRHLEWARRQGVPVPTPVAAGEFAGPWGRLQSFLAVEELTGMLPLHEAIPLAAARLDPAAFRRWKRGLVAETARVARLLHDRRCFHKDLYLCHFYVHADLLESPPDGPDGWRDRVWLIDLHRLGHHPWAWRLWQLKDLAQLLYSSDVAGVDARDQVYFWRHYRGLGPRRRADRWLRRCVLFKWRRYRQHNLRRKARLRPPAALEPPALEIWSSRPAPRAERELSPDAAPGGAARAEGPLPRGGRHP